MIQTERANRLIKFFRLGTGIRMPKSNLLLAYAAATVRELRDFLRWVIEIFLAAADTKLRRGDFEINVEYGVMNYRTNKLDDGTDPYGWYH